MLSSVILGSEALESVLKPREVFPLPSMRPMRPERMGTHGRGIP